MRKALNAEALCGRSFMGGGGGLAIVLIGDSIGSIRASGDGHLLIGTTLDGDAIVLAAGSAGLPDWFRERVLAVPSRRHTLAVPADERSVSVPSERRAFTIEAEERP